MFLTPGSRTGGGQYGLRESTWIQRAMRWTSAQRTTARKNINAPGNTTPEGRLTLQSLVPVMTTTQSAKTTIYYTPYTGDQIPIYDGTNMIPTAFSEVSVLTTDTTKSAAAIGVSKVNDWFIWNDAGTTRLGHGPDWASDSARTDALVMVNGIYLNAVAITNGPAVQRGTYVGTTRSDASSQLNWVYGSGSSGGSAGILGVWNCYNRVLATSISTDSGVSYTYTTGTTRQARASAGNQTEFVIGLQGDMGAVFGQFEQQTVAVAGAFTQTYVGYNSTTAQASSPRAITYTPLASSLAANTYPMYSNAPGIGYNKYTALERGDGTNANTFNNSSGNSLTVQVMM